MLQQIKHQPFDLKLPIEVIHYSAAGQPKGETRNVSSTGVLFSPPVPIEVGASIEYLITFPKVPGSRAEVRLRCVGKVVRHEPNALAATLERYEFQRTRG